ncbi:MAG: YopX family protein [Oscillospiraceae bacterium]|nr:YopX family protein [Oscillospiraceae bacterium]
MNERYLFRGKNIDDGEWVQGHIWGVRPKINGEQKDFAAMIAHIPTEDTYVSTWYAVDIATIGQCTGIQGEAYIGSLIFEGDILDDGDIRGVVEWQCDGWGVRCSPFSDSNLGMKIESLCDYLASDATIIGNIHDNPELLEVADGR